HGPDTLPLIIDIGFSRYIPQTGETLSTFVDNAHNIYLGYLADIGIVGLAAFLITVLSSLMSTRRSNCAALLSGTVTAYLIHGFFGLGLSLVSPIFWLFLGLCAANDNNIFSEE
ncbi:MAG: O-antigen ligase family protein, partial [Oscillospiraceae bacterium]|nr:O-antigen ligase family protein [Oscillospiraceae bacterium]